MQASVPKMVYRYTTDVTSGLFPRLRPELGSANVLTRIQVRYQNMWSLSDHQKSQARACSVLESPHRSTYSERLRNCGTILYLVEGSKHQERADATL